ncbi:unnamed protein product [Clonostachys rosea]|uniref:Ubiquitin 3 binding protein But2 C-terminal domain-containing protein n=1 Tax=Bionectria ochroleuca TaxID=29856 RepID=A0ABY6UNK2_BIOOC|nr:unnamed protein product [Clonostachys rosea]
MPFSKIFITLTSLLSVMGPVLAAPTEIINPIPEGNRIGPFQYYNLYPQEPERSEAPVQAVHVETYGGQSIREQVVIFKGIPPGAQQCQLKWAQAPTPNQVFIAKFGSNTEPGISTRQLSGFPAEGVPLSYASVQPFDTKDAATSPTINFENWDTPGSSGTHNGGITDCAETIYFKLAFKNTTANMHAYMAQDYGNGLQMYYQ